MFEWLLPYLFVLHPPPSVRSQTQSFFRLLRLSLYMRVFVCASPSLVSQKMRHYSLKWTQVRLVKMCISRQVRGIPMVESS